MNTPIFVSTKGGNAITHSQKLNNMAHSIENEIKQAIASIQGRSKDGSVESRRVDALRQKGFSVEYVGIMWNFGTAGTVVAEENGSYLAQLSCATGGKAKNGHGVNACHIHRVTPIA